MCEALYGEPETEMAMACCGLLHNLSCDPDIKRHVVKLGGHYCIYCCSQYVMYDDFNMYIYIYICLYIYKYIMYIYIYIYTSRPGDRGAPVPARGQ